MLWRRRRWVAAAVAILLTAYIGSYAALYRRGIVDADRFGCSGFFYVPLDKIALGDGSLKIGPLTRRHQFLERFYAPLNRMHRAWFGGRSPYLFPQEEEVPAGWVHAIIDPAIW